MLVPESRGASRAPPHWHDGCVFHILDFAGTAGRSLSWACLAVFRIVSGRAPGHFGGGVLRGQNVVNRAPPLGASETSTRPPA